MTQPPGAGTPPPPTTAGSSRSYWVPPGGASPGAAGVSPSGSSGRGRVSPVRLIVVFVAVLAVALGMGALVVFAVQPAARLVPCADPAVECGRPPVAATLPPRNLASNAPLATPAPTIVRPSGTLVIPSAAPSAAPASALASSPSPGAAPTAAASAAPSSPPVADLPLPLPASDAGALRIGQVWTSRDLGFSLEYNGRVWTIEEETATSLVLTAGNGAVLMSIEGFPASAASPKALLQQKVAALGDTVLGLIEEADPARQLPGRPIVGHRQGFGVLMNGTVDTPQGPSANVDVVILAATDNTISIRVTLVADDDLRDPAFSVGDAILNSLEWPAAGQ